MSRPIYFLPEITRAGLLDGGRFHQEVLLEHGLDVQFGDVRNPEAACAICDLSAKTPDAEGRGGVLLQFTGGQVPRLSGYMPKEQQWYQRPAGFDVCVGIDLAEPITPEDLLRDREPRCKGYAVTLGDSNDWVVPILRTPFNREDLGRSDLPCDWIYDEAGLPKKEILAQHRELWELSGRAWDHWFRKEDCPTINVELLLSIGVGALGLNYRLGKIEQTVLRLVNSENWELFMRAVLDLTFYEELWEASKKNEP